MALVLDGNGTIAGISAGGLPNDIITADNLNFGAGKILQIQRTFQTNASTENTSIGTYADLVGVNITPSSTSSKILLFTYIHLTVSDSYYGANIVFKRNSTILTVGDTAGSRSSVLANFGKWASDNCLTQVTAMYIDSPATTSQITYYVSGNKQNGGTLYINSSPTTTDSSSFVRATSALFALEVSA